MKILNFAVSGLLHVLSLLLVVSFQNKNFNFICFRFATEIFHGIQEEVMITASRSNKLKMKMKQIEATVPSIQKKVLAQTNHIHFAYTGGFLSCFSCQSSSLSRSKVFDSLFRLLHMSSFKKIITSLSLL